MFKIHNDSKEVFFQWDLNRKLVISDPTVDEVHFCNRTDDCALVVEVYDLDGLRVADVPNILLQTNWPIKAYAYCNQCYTKDSKIFQVIPRSKPADYVYTETEVRRWEDLANKLEEKINEVDAAEQDRRDAEEYRIGNETSRVVNEEARQERFSELDTAMDESLTYFQSTSDQMLGDFIQNSTQVFGDFEINSNAALNRVNTATEQAEMKIAELSGYREELDGAWMDINANTKNVRNHEKRITNLEEHINPQYFITDASAAAYEKVIPTDICPYAEVERIGGLSHKMVQLVDISNAQVKTLNGMTSDVSVNAGIITISRTSTYENQTWFNIQNQVTLIKDHVYYLCGCPAGGSTNTYGLYLSCGAMNSYIGDFGEGKLFTATYDATYDLSFFTAGAITVNYEVKPQLFDFTDMYGAGKEPSIAEFRAAFGNVVRKYYNGEIIHTPVKHLSTVGKNLWSYGDQTFTREKYIYLENPIKAGTYTISTLVTTTDTDESKCVMAFYSNHNVTGAYVTGAYFDRNTRSSVKVVFNKDVYTISLRAAESYGASTDDTVTWKDIQIERGEVATEYSPYSSRTGISVPTGVRNFEGYGWGINSEINNYIDFESKEYVQKVGRVDLGTLDYSYTTYGSNNIFVAYYEGINSNNGYSIADNLICSKYISLPRSELFVSGAVGIASQPTRIFIGDTTYTDVASFKQAMSGVFLYYALKTPVVRNISAILTQDNLIQVEGNGSITAVSDKTAPAATTITYLKKEV